MHRKGAAPFADRADAGRRLAERLLRLRGRDVVVLGLPRGGVPVGVEIARRLGAPLDVLAVRKLGVPFQPELAMGAVGEQGPAVLNPDVLDFSGTSHAELARVEQRERDEVELRVPRFRGGRPRIPLDGRTAVVVDDGIATGATARAACRVARARGAARVVFAAPVGSTRGTTLLRGEVDELVVLRTPEDFVAVGQAYDDFPLVSDEDVVALLRSAAEPVDEGPVAPTVESADPPARDEEVEVAAGPVHLAGHLTVPPHARGVVVFVHGSASGRHSPRNRYVAGTLQEAGLATLLFDLLTPDVDADRENVFAVDLLATRLTEVLAWLRRQPECRGLPLGLFGAGTGAAAALMAAAAAGSGVSAVVSRGGRPDLAGARLEEVRAPTLLLVGGRDEGVLELNEIAATRLRCERRLVIVPGAGHLFEERGALQAVARQTSDWFVPHLGVTTHGVRQPRIAGQVRHEDLSDRDLRSVRAAAPAHTLEDRGIPPPGTGEGRNRR